MISFRDLRERRTPLIVAHRGASRAAHENTLEAFQLAMAMGVDAVEFDVRRTADGELVIHHDPTVGDGGLPTGRSTYAQLAKAAQRAQFHLPTVRQALESCAGHIALDIELKEPGYEKQLLDLVQAHYDLSHVVFTSFRDEAVLAIKTLAPDAVAGLLVGAAPLSAVLEMPIHRSVAGRLRRCRADMVAPHWRRLGPSFLCQMRRLRMPVMAWTVDDPGRATRLAGARVAAIISNVPDVMRATLDSERHEA